MLEVGQAAPDFTAIATSGKPVSLKDLHGKNCVLYFYPKDCTSGCTLEGQNFRDHYAKFQKLNTLIFGVSRDSLKLHEKFKAEQQFPFELLSDSDERLCQLFDVMKDKTMYGKKVRGIERSTFLIDKHGIIRHIWRKVSVPGHLDEVLAAVNALNL
jgi:thioredoxin-dependent peroxiredoxin